jgi:phenylalanyl-tRNA synthetase alpha chain
MTETLPGAAVPNPLDEAAITAAVEQAISAIAGASTLDELKAVRLTHTGEKSPLSLANREIGSLPKDQKAAAGKLMGSSRGRVNKALAERTAELEAENDARILVEETVDVTAAPRRRRAGARSPPCRTAWQTSSSAWAGKSPRARKSSLNGSTSTH